MVESLMKPDYYNSDFFVEHTKSNKVKVWVNQGFQGSGATLFECFKEKNSVDQTDGIMQKKNTAED